MSCDINKVCRTCLTNDGPMISILKSNSADSNTVCVADMLNFFTTINLKTEDDQMPKRVCIPCINEINRCYTFKLKCEKSNNTLLQQLYDLTGTEELIPDVPARKVGRYETNDNDQYKREAIYSIKELGQQREELEHKPVETDELVQEPEELIPKYKEIHDPLEEDSDILNSKYYQDIEIVNAVKQFQFLYNSGNKDYKNKLKRRKAWHNISKAVNLPETFCRSRWKFLRDHYVKLTKSASSSSTESQMHRWPLLKYVEFLSDHISRKVMTDVSEYDIAQGIEVPITSKQKSNIKLVHEVQKFKCLYEGNSREYANKILRLKAWHEVSIKMNLPENECQLRWKNIRDTYVRMCRSASESGEKEIENQWHMFKHVEFLKDYICPKRSATIAEIPSDCEPIEVDVTEITYHPDFDDSLDIS